jgi:hypothetical protein
VIYFVHIEAYIGHLVCNIFFFFHRLLVHVFKLISVILLGLFVNSFYEFVGYFNINLVNNSSS